MPRVTKPQAEEAILRRFVSAYEREFGVQLGEPIHGDRPDFEFVDPVTNEKLGLEVTGVYQTDDEAKIQYWAVEEWGVFHGSQEDLLTSINRIIAQKAPKSESYGYQGRLMLAIWLGSLVFNEKFDVEFIRPAIVSPPNTFADIWLITRDRKDHSDGLYRLQ